MNYSTFVAPFFGTIGEALDGILEKDQSRLLEYDFPDEGMTLSINVTEGKLLAHGSFTIKNPNTLTADFTVQSEDANPDINFFISPTLYEEKTSQINDTTNRRKRQTGDSIKKVYLSIVGLLSNNTFSLDTDIGDTTPPTLPPPITTPTLTSSRPSLTPTQTAPTPSSNVLILLTFTF